MNDDADDYDVMMMMFWDGSLVKERHLERDNGNCQRLFSVTLSANGTLSWIQLVICFLSRKSLPVKI